MSPTPTPTPASGVLAPSSSAGGMASDNPARQAHPAMSSTIRRHLLALVLVAMAWAWAVPGAQQPAAQGLAHELVHLQSVSHHHHADAALHLDDAAPAELSHHHASDVAKPLAWCTPAPGGLGLLQPQVFVTADEPHSLAIVLDGPLRPPSARRA